MATTTRWIIPCKFSEENRKTKPIEFDMTNYLRTILNNEVWKRKFDYGQSYGLKNTNPLEVSSATVKIYPKFISGSVNTNRIPDLIEYECGQIPMHFKVNSYKDWSYHNGFAIIETQYNYNTEKIPTKKDITSGFMPNIERKFYEDCSRFVSVLKELSAFFLAGLHLSFPTKTTMIMSDNPVNDGFVQIKSGRRSYAFSLSSNAFMHEILVETSKKNIIENNFSGLASVWHYNLWSLKRYLIAVESDQLSMDNLLDLVYALEGLFDKNASSDFIKLTCLITLCSNRKSARSMKMLLDLAYKLRNDIAHGERLYNGVDYVKLDGKDILAESVYWKMKWVVASMIIKAISNLIDNKEQRNLRFSTDDFINKIFK
jgi:hypothetical protein